MEDISSIRRVVKILKATREEQNLSIRDVYKTTKIPKRRLKEIEAFDLDFFQNNQILFVRYCKAYQDFLNIDSDEFDRVSELDCNDIDDDIIDPELAKKPTIDHIEIALICAIIFWGYVSYQNYSTDKKIVKQLTPERLLTLEDISK
ncbi:MAG: helix-turn-helix domain-containing protein [Rickettsiales bacterium]|nr:helix-turn-helix domain-containing protein [Rickettsiales bacterium]